MQVDLAGLRVISVNGELDGRDMPLCDALEIAIGKGQGTLISRIGGALGYFEGEEAEYER